MELAMMPPQAAAGFPGMGGLGMGGPSPDGLGAMRTIPQQSTVRYHPSPLEMQPMPVGMTLPIEPKDTSSGAAVQSAGFTALLSAIAIGLGVATGGAYGAGAGLMLAGALANGYRAQKWINEQDAERRHEAVVSATFAVGELALGGYLAYKAYKAKQG
jgi:hypothetical protein